MHRHLGIYLIAFAALAGCAAHSTVMNRPVEPDEVPRLIGDSPHISRLSSQTYPKRTESSNIQFFNYTFNLLSRPDLIKDWQYHYVVGPASSPTWRYEKLAEVLVYLHSRDDPTAFARLGEVASSLGGDAVIDMHRKPIITRKPPAPVDAYMYYGMVVRKSD